MGVTRRSIRVGSWYPPAGGPESCHAAPRAIRQPAESSGGARHSFAKASESEGGYAVPRTEGRGRGFCHPGTKLFGVRRGRGTMLIERRKHVRVLLIC